MLNSLLMYETDSCIYLRAAARVPMEQATSIWGIHNQHKSFNFGLSFLFYSQFESYTVLNARLVIFTTKETE